MLVTSKEANKLLQQLEREEASLINEQNQSSTFLASLGEDVESCRPEYDYDFNQARIRSVDRRIVELKHAINKFNTETIVDGFEMTIDEMLVYIPQLTQRKNRLDSLRSRLPKERESNVYRSNIVDYRYVNYDINKAKKDYEDICEELSKAQVALDKANITKKLEVNL